MKKLATILLGATWVASCTQITTNNSELSDLEKTANNLGDVYVACIVNQSMENASTNSIDVATAIKIAGRACETELAQFEKIKQETLSAQYMLTQKPLQASIDALNERATVEVGDALLAAGNSQAVAIIPATAAITASATPSTAGEWSGEQQAYLDCMQEQARKYAALDESASVVADVAQSRCKSKLTGPGAPALEQEGRAGAMGVVLDAKLEGPPDS